MFRLTRSSRSRPEARVHAVPASPPARLRRERLARSRIHAAHSAVRLQGAGLRDSPRPNRRPSGASIPPRMRSRAHESAGSSTRQTQHAAPWRCAALPMSAHRARPSSTDASGPVRAPTASPHRARSAAPKVRAQCAAATNPTPRPPPAMSPRCLGTGSRRRGSRTRGIPPRQRSRA